MCRSLQEFLSAYIHPHGNFRTVLQHLFAGSMELMLRLAKVPLMVVPSK
jgi:hypothetical protein